MQHSVVTATGGTLPEAGAEHEGARGRVRVPRGTRSVDDLPSTRIRLTAAGVNDVTRTEQAVGDDSPPDEEWWAALFRTIDARDAPAFAAYFAAGGEFRFANAPPLRGRDAVRAGVAEFFAAIRGCRHRLLHTWHGPASAVCEGRVTYVRHDGREIDLPFVNVLGFDGGRIASYRIYIDNAPLFAPG
jgi:ketosteroid isomerase-like protein